MRGIISFKYQELFQIQPRSASYQKSKRRLVSSISVIIPGRKLRAVIQIHPLRIHFINVVHSIQTEIHVNAPITVFRADTAVCLIKPVLCCGQPYHIIPVLRNHITKGKHPPALPAIFKYPAHHLMNIGQYRIFPAPLL